MLSPAPLDIADSVIGILDMSASSFPLASCMLVVSYRAN
jgi:hypothetical protein